MSLAKAIAERLRHVQEKNPQGKTHRRAYINLLPTLNKKDFPDSMELGNLVRAGSRLSQVLKQADLTKGERIGISNIIDDVEMIGDHRVTLGDIRALNLRQLMQLRNEFPFDKPSAESLRKLKRLCGGRGRINWFFARK